MSSSGNWFIQHGLACDSLDIKGLLHQQKPNALQHDFLVSFHFQAKDDLDKFPASAGPDLAKKSGKENLADAAPLQSTSNDLVMVAELQKVRGLKYKNFSKTLQLDVKKTLSFLFPFILS